MRAHPLSAPCTSNGTLKSIRKDTWNHVNFELKTTLTRSLVFIVFGQESSSRIYIFCSPQIDISVRPMTRVVVCPTWDVSMNYFGCLVEICSLAIFSIWRSAGGLVLDLRSQRSACTANPFRPCGQAVVFCLSGLQQTVTFIIDSSADFFCFSFGFISEIKIGPFHCHMFCVQSAQREVVGLWRS